MQSITSNGKMTLNFMMCHLTVRNYVMCSNKRRIITLNLLHTNQTTIYDKKRLRSLNNSKFYVPLLVR